MLAKRYVVFIALVVTLSAAAISGFAQNAADAVSRVPELEAFHEVIHKIWHDAYPEKDIALMQQLLPDVVQRSVRFSRNAFAVCPGTTELLQLAGAGRQTEDPLGRH